MVANKSEGLPNSPERFLDMREAALNVREKALREREEAFENQEKRAHEPVDSITPDEKEQHSEAEKSSEVETQNRELRLANEHLILATIEAQELREAAVMARRRQDEFLAMLAHELRNPLGPIRNAVEILARLDDAKPIPGSVLDIIRRQVQQMARLLDDLLDVSRVTQGKVTLQRVPVDVTEFINRAVEGTHQLVKARSQQLTLELPTLPLFVEGDLVRLTQVISNLLQNACKYTQPGGTIRLCAERKGESVVVRVIDNGAGISATALPHVFELFAQDERTMARSQGGLGIGLTVARRVVELHDGSVEVFSEGAGLGSVFVVTLPRLEHRAVAEIASRAVGLLAPAPARVLVIEDNVDACETLSAFLSQSGHEVEVALDGQSGVDAFDRFKPQVVLCDIGLPGLDGYAVAAHVRERLRTERPALVALTGYGSAKDHERTKAAGFDHHLVKPADPEVLLRIIESTMRAQEWPTLPGGSRPKALPGVSQEMGRSGRLV